MPNTKPLGTTVLAVHCDAEHRFSKQATLSITMMQGLGVKGDAHYGATVQHRSRVKVDPTQPNLRQVHLISADLFDHLNGLGHTLKPGELGENITLASAPGLGWRELIDLPVKTRLIFEDANGTTCGELELTGLRNPCIQIEDFQKNLLPAMLDRDPDGQLVRKTGVMSIVLQGGEVRVDTQVRVVLPEPPHQRMERI
ncbi:MOSC domain-containing protein [Diaphorobacter sp. HDW4A]|uniref:MOSC domain-containing protein n=1 Tax=Diaphorobacter sp. HDW4A TaxID=2714924 RepID=UPI001407A73D|nr:MOSC domain-containing protein [Diaphorobacter sp. HDW4A]QIL80055.1 MOSC domain-containing protein [Diaphorobacter sp. HDW4A]